MIVGQHKAVGPGPGMHSRLKRRKKRSVSLTVAKDPPSVFNASFFHSFRREWAFLIGRAKEWTHGHKKADGWGGENRLRFSPPEHSSGSLRPSLYASCGPGTALFFARPHKKAMGRSLLRVKAVVDGEFVLDFF